MLCCIALGCVVVFFCDVCRVVLYCVVLCCIVCWHVQKWTVQTTSQIDNQDGQRQKDRQARQTDRGKNEQRGR
jgi:hypothetical protein